MDETVSKQLFKAHMAEQLPAGETTAEDEAITLQQGDWLEACTTADGAVLTFTVTTSHGSTTYNATVRA